MESFARFKSLQAKNLLYYQIEIANLESKLITREQDDMDPKHDDPDSQYKGSDIHRNPEIMIPVSPKKPPHPQWAKVKQIRQLLHDYSKSVPPHSLPTTQANIYSSSEVNQTNRRGRLAVRQNLRSC